MKTPTLLLIALFFVAFDVSADMYKCVDGSGDISFSDKPCATTPASSQTAAKSFHANLLIVDSHSDIENWVRLAPARRLPNVDHLRHVARGEKLYLPVIATFPGSQVGNKIALVADMEVSSPSGRLQKLPSCCFANRVDPNAPETIVLEPVVDITLDSGDPDGDYTVRATISNGRESAEVQEVFNLK